MRTRVITKVINRQQAEILLKDRRGIYTVVFERRKPSKSGEIHRKMNCRRPSPSKNSAQRYSFSQKGLIPVVDMRLALKREKRTIRTVSIEDVLIIKSQGIRYIVK